MTDGTINLPIDLRFPDGTDYAGQLELGCTTPNDLVESLLVVSTLPDCVQEQRERIVESIHLALTNWCDRNGVALTADPTEAIDSVVAALLPDEDEIGPTDVQRSKFARFEAWELRDDAVATLRRVIVFGGLEPEALGVRWGVTAFPNPKTGFRLNVGNRLSADIRSQGSLRLYLIGDQPDVSDFDGIEIIDGFDKVDGSYSLLANPGEPTEIVLADDEVRRQHRRFVEAHDRLLQHRSWHNPLVEPLLDDT